MYRHWERFSNEMGIKSSLVFRTVKTVIRTVRKEIPSGKEELEALALSEPERAFLDKLTRHIGKSATQSDLLQLSPESRNLEMDMGIRPGEDENDRGGRS